MFSANNVAVRTAAVPAAIVLACTVMAGAEVGDWHTMLAAFIVGALCTAVHLLLEVPVMKALGLSQKGFVQALTLIGLYAAGSAVAVFAMSAMFGWWK